MPLAAISKNEAETRYELIDPVLRAKGYRLPYIRLETPAPVEPIGPKGRRRKGPGRTDYLLCVETPSGPAPFPSYARLFAHRGTKKGESRYSWTVDFAARRKQATADMQPHIAEAERIKAEVVTLKEKLKALRKTDAKPAAIEPLEAQIKEQEKAARDSQSKADAIGATVFDLKAVNPNVVVKLDTRTPGEVIQSIQAQAAIVTQSLQVLQRLLGSDNPVPSTSQAKADTPSNT